MKLITVLTDPSSASSLGRELEKQDFVFAMSASPAKSSRGSCGCFIASEDARLDEAAEIIRRCCSHRRRPVQSFADPDAVIFDPAKYPADEDEGGAVYFVSDAEIFGKL